MRLLLIVNPAASSVTPRRRSAVERVLRDGTDLDGARHELEVVETTARGDAHAFAEKATRDDVEVVVVLAGDGTLNEAANGLAASPTALAALPGGSTNVFARTLGVAYDPVVAAEQVLSSLERKALRRVGLGAATPPGASTRRFLFHLGLGFDAAVIGRMERRPAVKRYAAHLAFAAIAFDTWLRRYDRNQEIRVETVASGPYAVISNSTPYTYIGRRRLTLTPDAALDRGLAATVFTNLHASLLLRATASGATRARFVTHSAAIVQRADIDHLTISADRPFSWQVDGDCLGEVSHLDVTYEPDALTLVVP